MPPPSRLALSVLAALALLPLASTPVACAPSSPSREATPSRAPVTEFVAIPWGFSTTSYWIEGPTGLVAIDTQFLPSEAERMIATASLRTGKKFVLAIVLHANPDKFNGTAVFQKHGIPVVTSQQVKDLLPEVHEKRLRAFYERYQPDYPKELPQPSSFGSATTELKAGGLVLKAHVLGAGCSEAHVAIEWDKHLFVGDLVANKSHSWLEIGKTDQWLRRLSELRALSPRFIHPGRGRSGGPELLGAQEKYLQEVISVVAEEKPSLPPDEAAMERAKSRIRAAYPGHDYAVFLDIGMPAEWARQARGGK